MQMQIITTSMYGSEDNKMITITLESWDDLTPAFAGAIVELLTEAKENN